ncbi:MAG: hypothetical protein ABIJ11_00735 [Elusimicrobiota bacterium]
MNIKIFWFMVYACIFLPGQLFGWGFEIHKYINRGAVRLLPAEMDDFGFYEDYLVENAPAPDHWKTFAKDEGIRHYMDMDNFEKYPFKNMPRKYKDMIQKYGREKVHENGLLPWATLQCIELLTGYMKSGKWPEALLVAATLGHYVGDGHQPLHTAANYDGQLTGNTGIHFRYEVTMTEAFLAEITLDGGAPVYASVASPEKPGKKDEKSGMADAQARKTRSQLAKKVKSVKKPLDYIFDYITVSYPGVKPIMDADTKHKGNIESDPDRYYRLIWQDTRPMTSVALQNARVALASLWYTAWKNAGSPKIPRIPSGKLLTITTEQEWKDVFGSFDKSKIIQ